MEGGVKLPSDEAERTQSLLFFSSSSSFLLFYIASSNLSLIIELKLIIPRSPGAKDGGGVEIEVDK